MSGKKKYAYFKNNESDKISWIRSSGVGEFLFTFDGKQIFNLFADYPHALTQEQREVFDKENPYWAEYFSDRR